MVLREFWDASQHGIIIEVRIEKYKGKNNELTIIRHCSKALHRDLFLRRKADALPIPIIQL